MSTRLICADVREGLRQLDDASVHCVVTSPPYWGLRNYGIEPSVWGGRASCEHVWGDRARGPRGDILPLGESKVRRISTTEAQQGTNDGGQWCERCGAWLGCLGLEPTPDLFVEHIVEIFRDVRRVLHPSGTLWLNFGDCYIAQPHGTSPSFDPKYPAGRDRSEGGGANRKPQANLKSKDLVMMPARIALALQADGWYLRQQIPWLKRNCMPESCTDRPTTAVEYIYLLSKSEEYFYDRAAAMMPVSGTSHPRGNHGFGAKAHPVGANSRIHVDRDTRHGTEADIRHKYNRSFSAAVLGLVSHRARRNSDWFFDSLGSLAALVANPQPFTLELCTACSAIYERRDFRRLPLWSLATKRPVCPCQSDLASESTWLSHFATFPEAMVDPCILLGTSEYGACSHCGAPWERIVEKPQLGDWNADPSHKLRGRNSMVRQEAPGIRTLGWRPTCSPHPLFSSTTVPCVVLDPFGGSGTTAVVASRHGRDAILIDRNRDYLRLAEPPPRQARTICILRHFIAGGAAVPMESG